MKIYFFKEEDERPDTALLPSEFLEKLPVKIEARFRRYLQHLKESDGKIEGIAFRKLYDYPMEEIRIKESKNLHRLILHVKIKDTIYVLHGFTKKEDHKTPKKELDIAYNRLLKIIS